MKNTESNRIAEVVSQSRSMTGGESSHCRIVQVGVSQCPTGGGLIIMAPLQISFTVGQPLWIAASTNEEFSEDSLLLKTKPASTTYIYCIVLPTREILKVRKIWVFFYPASVSPKSTKRKLFATGYTDEDILSHEKELCGGTWGA
jgi:hypothetical protein